MKFLLFILSMSYVYFGTNLWGNIEIRFKSTSRPLLGVITEKGRSKYGQERQQIKFKKKQCQESNILLNVVLLVQLQWNQVRGDVLKVVRLKSIKYQYI